MTACFRRVARLVLLLVFLAVNLGIASPALARLTNDVCYDGTGEAYPCCTFCIFFCLCTVVE